MQLSTGRCCWIHRTASFLHDVLVTPIVPECIISLSACISITAYWEPNDLKTKRETEQLLSLPTLCTKCNAHGLKVLPICLMLPKTTYFWLALFEVAEPKRRSPDPQGVCTLFCRSDLEMLSWLVLRKTSSVEIEMLPGFSCLFFDQEEPRLREGFLAHLICQVQMPFVLLL